MKKTKALPTVQGEKRLIFYKREYRHVENNPIETLIMLFITVVPFLMLLRYVYSAYSYWLNDQLLKFFRHFFAIDATIQGHKLFPFMDEFYYLDLEGVTPSFSFCLMIAIGSLILTDIFLQTFKNNKPLMIYLSITLMITFLSALFFIFFPEHFPYTLGSYTYMYIGQQYVVWSMIAIVASISLSLLPGIYGFDVLTFFLIMFYTIVYGSLRYIVFMVALQCISNLFLAPFYFMFGIFFDFMHVIGIYAIFVKRASDQYTKRRESGIWIW